MEEVEQEMLMKKREDVEDSENHLDNVIENQPNTAPSQDKKADERSYGTLHIENGERVVYDTDLKGNERRTVIGAGKTEAEALQEMLVLKKYPDLGEQIYGKLNKQEDVVRQEAEMEDARKVKDSGLETKMERSLNAENYKNVFHEYLVDMLNANLQDLTGEEIVGSVERLRKEDAWLLEKDVILEYEEITGEELFSYSNGISEVKKDEIVRDDEKSREQRQKQKCPNKRCFHDNRAEARYCGRCGRQLYEESIVEKISESTEDVRKIGGIVVRDLGELVKRTSKGTFKVACKASYPILGNLSANLQTRIQNAVGKENYDAVNATKSSILVNSAVNTVGGGIGCSYLLYNQASVRGLASAIAAGTVCGCILGGIYSMLTEFIPRSSSRHDVFVDKACASWFGKIISLPIEGAINGYEGAINAYNGIKNYVKSVKERAKREK